MRRRLPRINGRRGAFQLLFGIAFLMLGISQFIRDEYTPALQWLAEYFPAPGPFGIVWLAAGVAGIIGSVLPRPKDRYSFILLTAAPTFWGGLSVIGGLVGPANTSFLAAVMYWTVAGAVMVVSGMTGDTDRDHREVAL